MLTATAVAQGNIITEGLQAWFDFGDTQCFNPTLFTGSISAGTPFFNLAPNPSPVSGSITGAVNWSTAFGGCMNLTNASTSTLEYTAGISASFTFQVVVTPGTDASPNNNWTNDSGAWPGFRPGTGNGFVWAQQFGASPGNYLIPVIFSGTSGATLSCRAPADGWNEYARFPSVYSFTTNGTNNHNAYMNNVTKTTDTSSRSHANSAVGQIYLNFDPAVSTRHGLGRIVAFLHYNRQLSDAEVYQNAQFYLNRIGVR